MRELLKDLRNQELFVNGKSNNHNYGLIDSFIDSRSIQFDSYIPVSSPKGERNLFRFIRPNGMLGNKIRDFDIRIEPKESTKVKSTKETKTVFPQNRREYTNLQLDKFI